MTDKLTLFGEVCEEAARRFEITQPELMWRIRAPRLVRARQWVWMVLHDTYGWSFPDIAKAMGFNHTTVLHGTRKARKRWAVDNAPPKAPTPGQWSTCSSKRYEAFPYAAKENTNEANSYEAERAAEALAI